MSQKRSLEEETSTETGEESVVKRACPENGRPGDWLCPSCQHHNWSFRNTCQKCNTNKDGEQTDVAAPTPDGGRPGDWNCSSCAHLNYAFRTSCQRCYAPKPFDTGAAGAGGAAQPTRSGDWTCPTCGDLVYSTRFACRKCHTPKSAAAMMGMVLPGGPGESGGYGQMGGMPGAYGGAPPNPYAAPGKPSAPPKETRVGDWSCPKCFDVNYATRNVCRLCHTPKPIADPTSALSQMYGYDMSAYGDMGAYGFSMGTTPGQAPGRRSGDWDCPNCGDVVYSTRQECRKCKTAKPEHLGPSVSNPSYHKPLMNGGLGPSRRAGDWDCPSCGDVQYASRTECRKCRTAKPEI